MKANIFILFLFLGGALMAQDRSAAVEQAVQELNQRYQLNDQQLAEVYVIQERKERNLAEIAHLESTDQRTYLEKKRIIRTHTEGSIRRFLTPAQRSIQHQEQTEYRRATSKLIQQMQREGKSKEEIQLILLERG